MRTTSRRGSCESARMLPATLSAGAKRVADAPGLAVDTAAVSAVRSGADRTAISAPEPKSTTDPRSAAPRLPICSCAAARARSQRSP